MKRLSGKDMLVYSVAAICLIATLAFLALGKDKQATVACSIGGLLSVCWVSAADRAMDVLAPNSAPLTATKAVALEN
jgi:hypothetical protein